MTNPSQQGSSSSSSSSGPEQALPAAAEAQDAVTSGSGPTGPATSAPDDSTRRRPATEGDDGSGNTEPTAPSSGTTAPGGATAAAGTAAAGTAAAGRAAADGTRSRRRTSSRAAPGPQAHDAMSATGGGGGASGAGAGAGSGSGAGGGSSSGGAGMNTRSMGANSNAEARAIWERHLAGAAAGETGQTIGATGGGSSRAGAAAAAAAGGLPSLAGAGGQGGPTLSRAFDLFMSPSFAPGMAFSPAGGAYSLGALGPGGGAYYAVPSSSSQQVHAAHADALALNGGAAGVSAVVGGASTAAAAAAGSSSSNGAGGGALFAGVGRPAAFFTPSYLRGSSYLLRLEQQHRARLAAHRDGLLNGHGSSSYRSHPPSRHQNGHNGVSQATGGPATAANGSGVISIGPGVGNGAAQQHHHRYEAGAAAQQQQQQQQQQQAGGAGHAPSYGYATSGAAAPGSKPRVGGGAGLGLGYDGLDGPGGCDWGALLLLADEESLAPLPSRWNPADKWGGLEVLGADGLEVKHTAPRSSERDHEACSVRADQPMPPQCGVYYFEVTVLSRKREETTIGVGFSTKTVSLARVPGWEPESWGYHGDDGHCFAAQNVGKHYGPTFSTADTVGCGVNFRTGTAFFTKNGSSLGTAFRDIKGSMKLYPSVGLKKQGDHVRVNFGQTPFVFDIDAYMRKEKQTVKDKIDETSTSKLAPPLSETGLIQALVLQFLQQDGYVETARAFAEEIHGEKLALRTDPSQAIEGISVRDDEDANKRQRIRRAVLEGDVDLALKYTTAYYPYVLREHDRVYFRLRCRKFIELVRKAAELGGGETAGGRNGTAGFAAAAKRRRLDEDSDDEEALEDDDEDDDEEDMDLDDEAAAMMTDSAVMAADGADDQDMGSLLAHTLDYGRELDAEFRDGHPREFGKTLDDIFALLAYENPLKAKEVAHLLDRRGRVAVAEELNSAILLSLGKSSRSALENLYAQTSVLLDDLRQEGGPGAFVTLQGIIDGIPKQQPF